MPGTDSMAPSFSLDPAIPGIDGTWCTGTSALTPAGTTSIRFDTGNGEIFDVSNGTTLRAAGTGLDGATGIRFEIASQGGGMPDIGVFSMASFDLPAGVTANAIGGNALGLLSCGDVNILGVIDIRGTFGTPGPGGYPGGSGDGNPAGNATAPDGTGGEGGFSDQTASGAEGGGGGGGLGGSGGPGGDFIDATGAPGGTWAGMATAVPLRGGGGGGGGGGGCVPFGGGGGGALYLGASGDVFIASGGGINAGGGGGEGCSDSGGNGGAAGGAGGMILIEGATFTVDPGGTVASNGGGGGGGSSGAPGTDGSPGLLAGSPAAPGMSPGTGDGGPGGANAGCDGAAGAYADDGSGGGGGGCGRIRLNTVSGFSTLLGIMSPSPSATDGAGVPLCTEGVAASNVAGFSPSGGSMRPVGEVHVWEHAHRARRGGRADRVRRHCGRGLSWSR